MSLWVHGRAAPYLASYRGTMINRLFSDILTGRAGGARNTLHVPPRERRGRFGWLGRGARQWIRSLSCRLTGWGTTCRRVMAIANERDGPRAYSINTSSPPCRCMEREDAAGRTRPCTCGTVARRTRDLSPRQLRRIMTMRSRTADIRLINRGKCLSPDTCTTAAFRSTNLGRSRKRLKQDLTRSLHIRRLFCRRTESHVRERP